MNTSLFRRFFSMKTFKLTLSNIDKFVTSNELSDMFKVHNQIDLIRLNKSTKKNYCHIEIKSELSIDELKLKFESMKILGKRVKLRIKENDIFNLKEIEEENLENYNDLNLYMENFYRKNFQNFIGFNLDFIKKFNFQEDYISKDIQRKLFNYEYDLIIKHSSARKYRSEFDSIYQLVPIKTYSLSKIDDDEFEEKFPSEKIKIIIQRILEVVSKLKLKKYDSLRSSGVWRGFQIKKYEDQYILNAMASNSELDDIDIQYIKEILKFEFKDLVDCVYLSINDKTNANFNNIKNFNSIHLATAEKAGILIKDLSKNYEIIVSPFVQNYLNFFENIDLSGLDIKNVFDFSCSILPQSIFLKNIKIDKLIFIPESDKILINKIDNKLNIPFREIITNLDAEEYQGLFDNNLTIINLRFVEKFEFSKLLEISRYFIIFSNKINQILDFLKNFKTRFIIEKIFLFKDTEYSLNEFVFIVKSLKE